MLASRLHHRGIGDRAAGPAFGPHSGWRCARGRVRAFLGTSTSGIRFPDIADAVEQAIAVGGTPHRRECARSRSWRVFWWGEFTLPRCWPSMPGRRVELRAPANSAPASSPPRDQPAPLRPRWGLLLHFPGRRSAWGIHSNGPHAPRDGAPRHLDRAAGAFRDWRQ